ncbi:hypothetical protein AB4Z22_41110, partial [Paenibacillus sp. TAF58]
MVDRNQIYNEQFAIYIHQFFVKTISFLSFTFNTVYSYRSAQGSKIKLLLYKKSLQVGGFSVAKDYK